MGKKKQSVNAARPKASSSKQRLKFIIKGDVGRSEVDPSMKKRKEIIQELRLSAAKIVIES